MYVTTPVPVKYAARIRDKTRGRIRSYLQSKDDWNLFRSLKNLVEQTVRDYEHRTLIELLQNAHDAHELFDRAGRVLVRLDHDEGEHGVLYVANAGRSFTDSNFEAITDVAQSDKRPEEGIGDKGIGFKSVLQLSRSPEIYSAPEGATAGDSLTGYCFRFADRIDLLAYLEQLGCLDDTAEIATDVERDVFHLCLPVTLGEVPDVVRCLAASGYVTVVRLPLKSEEARSEAAGQLRRLTDDPPALLFLRRIAELKIDELRDGASSIQTCRRKEAGVAELGDITIATVELGDTGTYLVADKPVPAAVFTKAIEQSIAGDHISEGWKDWSSEAHVAVALRLDSALESGRLYTHLPMGEDAVAPLPAHVNAPFFAKLARVNFEQSVPLNDMLLDQVAELCARVLLHAHSGDIFAPPDVIVDLLTWSAPGHQRLQSAFARLGSDIATAPVVPLAPAGQAWGSLTEAYVWDDTGRQVITGRELMAHADVRVVIPRLSTCRAKRLDEAANAFAGRRLIPRDSDVAGWSERVAHALASSAFDPERWGRFYDELDSAVHNRQVLLGRQILIDDDGRLRRCNVKDADGRAAVAFFSPRTDADADTSRAGPDHDLRPPARMRRRVFFVSQQISWNLRSGAVQAKRPGRRLLEDGLVHEYRASDLLPVIAKTLERRPSPELAAEVLMWTYRFARSRDEPPWQEIGNMRLLVPVQGGEWIPADQALLSKGWGGDTSLLNELLERSSDLSADFIELQQRLVIEPSHPPFRGQPRQEVRDFLSHIGVRTGLAPDPVPRSTLRAEGLQFERANSIAPAGLSPTTAELWQEAIGGKRPSSLRPYTLYLIRQQ